MRAAVLRAYNQPVEVMEVAEPEVGEGEVLVKVHAVGICGTDLKITTGAFPDTTPLPLIIGHEVAGELVTAAGDLRPGQRVACYFYDPCGHCRWCQAGQETICPNSRRIGFERHGGLADYVKVRQSNVFPFSERLPYEVAAVSMDSVMSPWHALIGRAGVQAGESVVVVGTGGLGLSGIQIARYAGARVAAVDIIASHRLEAVRLGAELAVAPTEAEEVKQWSGGGCDVGFEASGSRAGFDSAVACVRPGGRVVCCGYRPGIEYGLDSAYLILQEITVLGSRAGSREDAQAALKAVEQGAVRPTITGYLPIEETNRALEQLRKGGVLGRFVIQL
ncbi:MAG: alcohol dehydrogenase catalytic domain-containing protein [Chloroflexi bacterium]|nr:alcohol dehydrogenase catalytic domain-containing protein [Chloroflexota bacterium]